MSHNEPAPPRSRRLIDDVALALFFVALGALLIQAGDPFWLDELHTVWTARGDLGEVVDRATLGNQSPPFFLLEALVGRCFGYEPLAMRSLSALAGATALAIVFRTVASRAGLFPATCIWVALLAWPNLTFYFVESRPYAAVFLAATLVWTGLAEALSLPANETDEDEMPRRLRRARIAWTCGLVAAVWLHPTAVLLIPAVALAVMLAPLRKLYGLRMRLLDLTLVGIGCAIQIPLWLTLYGRRGAWNAFIHDPTWRDWLFDFDLPALLFLPLAAAVVGHVVARLRTGAWTSSRFARPLVFLGGLSGAVLIASVATWTDAARLYHFRYLIGAAAAAPLLAGELLGHVSHRWALRGLSIALLGTSLWATSGWTMLAETGRVVPPRRENWSGLVARLVASPPGPIVLDADVIESARWAESDDPRRREYLAFPLRAFDTARDFYVQSISYREADGVALTPETVELANEAGRLYAVARGGEGAPAKMRRRLANRLPEEFDPTPEIESFGRVWLLTYRRTGT